MRNKIFAAIVSVFILAVFLSSPLVYILSKNGIVTVDNVGNIIEVEKTYEDDFPVAPFFNAIEEGKRVVNDVYINYIPGYVPITTFTTSLFTAINSGVTDSLGNWGNDIIRDSLKNETPTTPTTSTTPSTPNQEPSTQIVTEVVTEIVTEKVTEIVTEKVTEIVTEKVEVTDEVGEIVTDDEGGVVTEIVTDVVTNIVTEVVTDIVTEVVTEVVTQVVTVPPATSDAPVVPETPENPMVSYDYSTSLLSKDSNHRFYKVIAKGSDGSEKTFFCRVPAVNMTKLKSYSNAQIKKINSMADARTDVNFYVYVPTCLEDTALGMEIFPAESTKALFDNFVSSMSKNVNFDYLKFNTLDERCSKYFATDHHWNRYGSYEGYCDIVNMMKKNYSDFGNPRPIVKDYSFDAKLYGSLCIGTNNYSFYDPFGVFDLGLPDHDLVINQEPGYGGRFEFNKLLDKYTAGNFNKSRTYNHFMEFYRIAKTIEYPENNTGRNLLLIGDSFSTCVAEAIASHFDKTIVRYVDSTKPETINYSDYIDKNNITDVLILETSSRVVLNLYRDSLNNINVGGSN